MMLTVTCFNTLLGIQVRILAWKMPMLNLPDDICTMAFKERIREVFCMVSEQIHPRIISYIYIIYIYYVYVYIIYQ